MELEVSIKPDTSNELRSQIARALTGNVISKRELQRLVGRANHVAGIVPVWRPFLQQLWGALAGDGGNAPSKCIWTSQVRSALTWLDLFLEGVRGTVVRTFSLETWSNVAQPFLITLDASPWAWVVSLRSTTNLCPSSRVPSPIWILKYLVIALAKRLANKYGHLYLPWGLASTSPYNLCGKKGLR